MVKIFVLLATLMLADGKTDTMTGHHDPEFTVLEDCEAIIPAQTEFIVSHLKEGITLVSLECVKVDGKDDSI